MKGWRRGESEETRFSRYFDATPGMCWLWKGGNTNGYGTFGGDRAHRVAWRLRNGPIPTGKHVLHKCDAKACVNPDHLYVGGPSENMRDFIERGGARSQPKLAHALSFARAEEIRAKVARGEKQMALAYEYGISESMVSRIVHGERCSQESELDY